MLDERCRRCDPASVRPACYVGIEPAVVVDHDLAVARDPDIELQRVDAELERPLEAGQRVLRRVAARAAVALEIECHEIVYRTSGAEDASQMPAPTAATPTTRCAPSGSPMSAAARSDAAIGLTVIVLATRVGVVRSSA